IRPVVMKEIPIP
ncbi:hypothetical protein CP061683_0584B, partial [Chlamydia psittaci 06-1683]